MSFGPLSAATKRAATPRQLPSGRRARQFSGQAAPRIRRHDKPVNTIAGILGIASKNREVVTAMRNPRCEIRFAIRTISIAEQRVAAIPNRCGGMSGR